MSVPAFVGPECKPPLEAHLGTYVLRPLGPEDVAVDCAAVNESVELIRRTRGGAWPRGPITIEEDLGDLQEHARLFQAHQAFAYAISDERTGVCSGCFYIFPPHHPFDDTDQTHVRPDVDAVVSFWVTPKAYDEGLYAALFPFTADWLHSSWPFRNAYIVNREKPTAL